MVPTNKATTKLDVPLFYICRTLHDLKDPDKASPTSLATSLSALVVAFLTFPFAIFLNVMVLLAFYRKPALLTQANVFLRAIAVNDLLQGAVSCPLLLAKEIAYQMRLQNNCDVTLVIALFMRLHITSDILLTALNCERFIGLKFPMWHRVHVTKHRLLLAAVASFLVNLSLSTLRCFREEGRYMIVSLFIGCTIAAFVFAILIWRVILKRNQQAHPLSAQQNQNASSPSLSEKKVAKIATYLTAGFFLTRIIPLVMLTVILTKHNLMYEVEPILQSLSLLNAIANPLIYGLMNDNIRKACFELIKIG